jgi:hypothetical protein
MAISKPKNSNPLDDLVLNFDPFIANGLAALDAPSAAVQGTPGAQASGGDETPGPQVTGVVPPATADPDIPEAPTVSLFRIEVPGASVGLAATANAEGDAPPQVVGEPQPAAPDPGPQDPPPRPKSRTLALRRRFKRGPSVRARLRYPTQDQAIRVFRASRVCKPPTGGSPSTPPRPGLSRPSPRTSTRLHAAVPARRTTKNPRRSPAGGSLTQARWVLADHGQKLRWKRIRPLQTSRSRAS